MGFFDDIGRFLRKNIRYTGATLSAPFLTAGTRKRAFGLTRRESENFEILGKVQRGALLAAGTFVGGGYLLGKTPGLYGKATTLASGSRIAGASPLYLGYGQATPALAQTGFASGASIAGKGFGTPLIGGLAKSGGGLVAGIGRVLGGVGGLAKDVVVTGATALGIRNAFSGPTVLREGGPSGGPGGPTIVGFPQGVSSGLENDGTPTIGGLSRLFNNLGLQTDQPGAGILQTPALAGFSPLSIAVLAGAGLGLWWLVKRQ